MKETNSDILKIKKLFNTWRRKKRHSREPIPENLWRAAVGLCATHSMATICRELGLEHKKPREKKNSFVTVALPSSGGEVLPGGEVACEWIRPMDGARLRMHIGRDEVVAVMKAFLGGDQ